MESKIMTYRTICGSAVNQEQPATQQRDIKQNVSPLKSALSQKYVKQTRKLSNPLSFEDAPK